MSKKRILVCGLNFHGRAAIRTILRNSDLYDFIGIVDDGSSDIRQKYNIFGLYSFDELAGLNYDLIVVAGRYITEMKDKLIDFFVPLEKIWVMSRKDYIQSDVEISKRSKQVVGILKNLVDLLVKEKFDYWFVASSALALMRNQKMAEMADVDVVVPHEEMSRLFLLLQNKDEFSVIIKHIYSLDGLFWKRNEIYTIVIRPESDVTDFEPAVIDIHNLKIINKKGYYSFSEGVFFEVDAKHFLNYESFLIDGIEVRLPFDPDGYLCATYGDDWRIPCQYFLTTSHLGKVVL